MTTPLKLLVIEDVPADFLLLERHLRQHGLEVECQRVDSDAALDAALRNEWDLVLSDYNVPGMDFRSSLKRIQTSRPDLPVILVSGSVGEETAVELLRLGMTDFILKDHLARLPGAILRTLEEAKERSARQAAEAALQESETKYRLLAENAADFIFWRGADGQFKYLSPACEHITGHAPNELLSDPDWMVNMIHPDDRAKYLQHIENDRHADAKELEFRITHKDGSTRWIAHHCKPIFDEQGEYLGRTGTNRNITLRKQAEARRDLLSEALRQSALPLLLADAQGLVSYLNPAFTSLFGYRLEDLSGEPVSCLQPQTDVANLEQEEILRRVRTEGTWAGEVDRLAMDGTPIPTAASIGVIRDGNGELVGFVGSYLDLRTLRAKELELRKLAAAVEQSPESIAITDLKANIEYVNESFLRNTGYSREEVIGQNPRVLHSGRTPDATYAVLWENLTEGRVWQGEFYNKRKDGSEYIEHAIISPIRQPDGRITHYVSVKEDITEKKRTEAEIHRLAFYDTLTGLPNRVLLLEQMSQVLSATRQAGSHSALISFNIDRFKTINDAGGQMLGDTLLKAVGERLAKVLHDRVIVARIAGDEFGILLTGLEPQQDAASQNVLQVSKTIHDSLHEPFQLGNEHIALTTCLGIALFPENEMDTPLDILRRANTALHHAKTRGSGQTVLSDGNLDEIAKQRFNVEQELRQAIASNELRVYLQPQVDAAGRIVGAEALVRWLHPQRGLIAPGAFIPIAEESNLIIEIGTWVFNDVCRLLASKDMAACPVRIAVNISPRHFRQSDFVEQIRQGLASTGADPAHLTLEVTEGLVIDNINDVIAKMTELSSMGIHFSMDDFGTGYSSLSYLKRLPIHEIKIDKSFIQDMTKDVNDAALVETILSVAKHMHLQVVAEGVETAEQAAFLNQRGQVIHQGYLFGKPEPAEIWVARLKNSFLLCDASRTPTDTNMRP